MDTGLGNFARITEHVFEEAEQRGMSGFFKEGEVIKLRGSKFTIWKITSDKLVLRLLEHKE